MPRHFDGSGEVSPAEQANEAYRQVRRSLIDFAAAEDALRELSARGGLSSTQESILMARVVNTRERVRLFAAVYLVERAEQEHRLSGRKLSAQGSLQSG